MKHNILRDGSEDSTVTHKSEWIYIYVGSLDIEQVFWEYARKKKKDFLF